MNVALIGVNELTRLVVEEIQKSKVSINSTKIIGIYDFNKSNEIHYKNIKIYNNLNEIYSDNGIDTIIVLTTTLEAKDIIEKALTNKKHVISVNKDVLAIYHNKLFDIALKNNVGLYFDAAIGGGIPITDFLSNMSKSDEIYDIKAILNGTSNFILTAMNQSELDLNVGLMQAVANGYAEEDPIQDISGFDAARSLSMIATLAYNKNITVDDIFIKGIEKVNIDSLQIAKGLGYTIKQIASASMFEGSLSLYVLPCFVKDNILLSRVDGNMGALYLTSKNLGYSMIYGPATGNKEILNAIIQDINKVENLINNNGVFNAFNYLDESKNIVTNSVQSEFIFIGEKESIVNLNDQIGNIMIDENTLVVSVTIEKAYEYANSYNLHAFPLVY
ncbi:homoserine dehydrogenase [Mycoplasma sp. P36-A1]|uniref:homoserine dehydrogenase n=1 Tax=Mycoplasma sp. P36-A1 TaxID=3252900 RepID=UPI003C2FBE4A